MTAEPTRTEQTRARYPDADGFVERDGVSIFWECYGEGEQTILFLPTWSIIHSRTWKMQVPYLSRHCRVLTFDPRGNGKSDRPQEPDAQGIQDGLSAFSVHRPASPYGRWACRGR